MTIRRVTIRFAGCLALCAALLLTPATRASKPGSTDSSWKVGLSASGVAADEVTSYPDTLRQARYEIDILGSVAMGTLVQEFLNTGDEAIRVDYVASRPAGLKIVSLELEIDGEVHDALAEKPAAGATAGKRPAPKRTAPRSKPAVRELSTPLSLEPNQSATVRIAFQRTLPTIGGRFILSLPRVEGTDGRPPIEEPVRLLARVHHEEPLADVRSESHELFVTYEGDSTIIELDRANSGDSRGFELEFAFGTEQEATLVGFVGAKKDGVSEVLLVLAPPVRPRSESVRPKQVLFVLDTSGSMGKDHKLQQAFGALSSSLEKLSTEDRYNIIEFDAAFSLMSPEPVSLDGSPPETARSWLAAQRPGGSTQLLPALTAAFEQPLDPERHRMIVVLTDGAFQNQQASLKLVREKLGEGRLFVVGIGSDVKRDVVEQLADLGRGAAVFTTDPEGLEPALAGLFDSISEPLAWDLELDWGDSDVVVLDPRRLPDLYAGRSVTIRTRVRGRLPSTVRVHGMTMDGIRTFTSSLPVSEKMPGAR